MQATLRTGMGYVRRPRRIRSVYKRRPRNEGGQPAELVDRVIDELSGIGLIDRRQVIESRHHFLPNAYPVYSLDYAANVRAILDALPSIAGSCAQLWRPQNSSVGQVIWPSTSFA